eukprot:Gb_00781 [translate_table: standard]
MGINYGQVKDNLPSPDQVVGFLQSNNINKVKLYSANETVLKAFANSGIELILGLGIEYVGNMTDPEKATEWVYTGNETELMANLVPAMKNIHSTLVEIGLDMNVTITIAHSLVVLGSSFPPSSGSFGPDRTGLVKPLLDFLSQIGASFFINAYPYFAYKSSPDQVPLDYALFQQNAGVVDPITNLHYDNLLYAQIDAVYSALSALGYANLEVIVSETGWPLMGDPDEAGATPQNAQTYNGNLLQRLAQKQGTPLRPTLSLQDYIFALFNEDMKPGPTSERNYGLFKLDGTPVYNVGLIGSLPTASSTSPSSSYNFMSSAKETRSVLSLIIYLQVLGVSSFFVILLFLP